MVKAKNNTACFVFTGYHIVRRCHISKQLVFQQPEHLFEIRLVSEIMIYIQECANASRSLSLGGNGRLIYRVVKLLTL